MGKINELINRISGGVETYQKGLLFDEYFIPVAIVVGVIFLIMVIIIIRLQRANKRVRTCLNCGLTNAVSAKFCRDCGHQMVTSSQKKQALAKRKKKKRNNLIKAMMVMNMQGGQAPPQMLVCQNCGAQIPPGSAGCTNCGQKIQVTPVQPQPPPQQPLLWPM